MDSATGVFLSVFVTLFYGCFWKLDRNAFIEMITFFFSIRVFFTDTNDSQDSRGREGTIFNSSLPLPPAHEHWDIYLQLCMWDDYHVFLIAPLVFYQTATRWDLPPYRITIWVIDWWCNVCLFTWWIDIKFFVTAIWHWKPVDLNSHCLSPLYYKRPD